MAEGKLPLLKRGSQPKAAEPKEVPVFDPDRLAAQVVSEGRACFVQGKHLFRIGGGYVGEAPEYQWYITTPEMEENNRRAKARQKAKVIGPTAKPAQMPEKAVQVLRENAQALAAEGYAE